MRAHAEPDVVDRMFLTIMALIEAVEVLGMTIETLQSAPLGTRVDTHELIDQARNVVLQSQAELNGLRTALGHRHLH